MRRGSSANHMRYGFQRRKTPPGKESSSSPGDNVGEIMLEADLEPAGGGHSTKVGATATGFDFRLIFCFHFSNEVFAIFSR